MKRWILMCVLAGTALAAVDTKFASLVTDAEQRQKVITARAQLQNIYHEIQNTDAELTAIATSGSFNTVDAELKQTLLAGWRIVQDANDAFVNDPNLMKLLNWRP